MSRYFITDGPVGIPEDNPADADRPNIIYIKPRMDLETQNRVTGAMFTVDVKTNRVVDADTGRSMTALLVFNIVRWEGPDLGSIPCTPANIRKLDPKNPHVEKVFAELNRRNAPKPSPDPNSVTPSGALSGGATASPTPSSGLSHQLATSTPK